MALHKESYGLIYNDDGSLCVTLRKDDVPFEGVTSFAVEEGTTNLLSNPSFETYTGTSGVADNWLRASNSTVTPNYSVESIGYNSNRSQKIEITNSTGLGDAIVYRLHTLTIGSTYTLSAYVRGNVTGTCVGFVRIVPKLGGGANINTFVTYFVPTNQWQRVSVTATIPEETSYCEITVGLRAMTAGDFGTLYIDNVQLEEKPFATSFVDGTRADGRLAIPINFRTNLVISGWFKPYGTSGNYNTQGGWARIVNFSNSNDTRRVTLAYNRRDSHPDFQKFQLSIYNASGDVIVSTSNVYPFNKWYFWVLIIEDASTTAYIFDENGNMEKIVNTNSIPLSDISSSPLYIGHRTTGTTDVLNGVISNLLIARYDPAIWTDDYIQALYDAKKPFAVPPKMPII
jgi:hypothetical protein